MQVTFGRGRRAWMSPIDTSSAGVADRSSSSAFVDDCGAIIFKSRKNAQFMLLASNMHCNVREIDIGIDGRVPGVPAALRDLRENRST